MEINVKSKWTALNERLWVGIYNRLMIILEMFMQDGDHVV